jgi:glycosyltransferase involved in cell wall biosynthesis
MDLSILIPARNEMFLSRTIDDILEHMEGNTEVIAVLDGAWADPPIQDHPRVTLVYHPVSVGQRAATNEAARLSSARYVMKCDAHCAFDQGFDVKMMADMQGDWTMVPKMYNLHAFDWVCDSCGYRRYQGPTKPCAKCESDMHREMVWKPKPSPTTTAMRFDRNLKFQYWSGYKKRQKGDLVDTMSILGACFMMTRDRYWELGICDEGHGSWGQQGTEVACKTWLSGGRLVCTKKTWFAHMFRTQGGDFGFPYPMSGSAVSKARKYSKRLWLGGEWDKAIHDLDWLIGKFAPVPDWEESDTLTKGMVYYTDNRLDGTIMDACQKQLALAANGRDLVTVSLKPMDFGRNITLDAERGYKTMFKQILAGLEASTADVIFLVEHDMLYHPSHFDFVPPRDDVFYYNQNRWNVDAETGKALFHYANSTSGLCAYRKLLLEHYRKRVEMVERDGFNFRMGFEPGTHGRAERVDDYKCDTWMSEHPNIDIRHKQNLTRSRWSKDQFRNQRFTKGWTEADEVPGWGRTLGRFDEVLSGVARSD